MAAAVNAGLARVFRDGLLWHTASSFRRSMAYALIVIAVAFAAEHGAWSVDATSFSDGHAIVSLDLALARAFCGVPSSFARTFRIPKDISARMALRHVPLRTLIVAKAGSIDAYCGAIDTPFVNSENSLMLVESAILRIVPGASLAQLGTAFHWIRIGCIAAFVLLLMDVGSSILLGLATFLCGLMLLQSMPDFVYSNYPFLFTLVLLDAAVTGFAIKYRWTRTAQGLVVFGAGAGLLAAFIANMRTSYLPIAGLFFALVLLEEWRPRGRALSLSRRSLRGLVLAGCFLAAYEAFEVGLITRHQPPEARYNAAHPLGHPLVLALAIPENALSREEGIRWADEVGPSIAARVDPSVTFMGPGYDAALLRYYGELWRTHPRAMLAVYTLKFSTAGSDMLRVLRRSPGTIGWAVGVLLTPMTILPNGLWILALYVAITVVAFTVYYTRGVPAAFAMALLSLAACLVQIESGVIFSIFVKQYHNYAAFYMLFLSLLGVQLLVNAAWTFARRLRLRGRAQA